jgi:general secretion pathway protein H
MTSRATPDRARTAGIMPPPGFGRMAGFTLMEIMVVVIIIGVMIAVTTLSVGLLGKDKETEDQLRRVWAVLRQTQEEGELQSIDTGMYFTDTSYEFLRFDARKNLWVPIEYDKLYATRELPEGLRFRIWLDSREIVLKPESADRADKDASKKWPPQIMVLSSGDIMPFEMRVERDGAEALWRVMAMPDNDLRLEKRVGIEPWSIVAQTRPPPTDDDKRVARATTR